MHKRFDLILQYYMHGDILCFGVTNYAWYRKTSNKGMASNKSQLLIGAGCMGTVNLKNASNYIPLINACFQLQPGVRHI